MSSPVSWDLESSAGTWITDGEYDTPDLSSILQGVINKVGWNSGQWVTFHILDDGTPYRDYRRGARSFDDNPAKTPEVYIRFTGGSDSSSSESSTSSDSSESSLSSSSSSSSSADSKSSSSASYGSEIYEIAASTDDGSVRWDDVNYEPSALAVRLGKVQSPGFRSWFRFDNLDIPIGATIQQAFIRFTCQTTTTTQNILVDIDFEAADDPGTSASGADINSRVPTGSAVTGWAPDATWTDGVNYNTPDISVPLQAVINRDGWVPGQAVMCLIDSSGGTTGHQHLASSYDFSTAESAELHVIFK